MGKLYTLGLVIFLLMSEPVQIFAKAGHYGIEARHTGRIVKSYPQLIKHLNLPPSEGVNTVEVPISKYLPKGTQKFFTSYTLKIKYAPSMTLPAFVTMYLLDQDDHIHDWLSFTFAPDTLENEGIDYHHTLGKVHKEDSEYHIRRLIRYEQTVGKVFSNAIGETVELVFEKTDTKILDDL